MKKLDIDALPVTPFDTTDFRPFRIPPEEARFDFSKLPDTAFNLDKIPSKSLQFKTSILNPPVVTKASPLSFKPGTPLSIFDIAKSQGLLEKAVLSLIKDKKGFVWISTEKAVYRFDGEYMQTYLLHSASGLIEDNSGRIWFASNRGIGIIDVTHGTTSFTTVINSPFPKLPKMILDDKGRIWVTQTDSKGVEIIDPQTQTYKQLNRSTGVSGTSTWGVFQDDKKNIWITTNDGADIISPGKGTISYLKKLNGLGSDSLYAITGDKNGRVWIAYRHGGVNMVDIEQGIIKRYGKLQGFDNNLTYRLLYDNKGRVWMATEHGLSIADPEKGTARFVRENEGIPEDYILDLLLDDKQRVWVATNSSGLSVIEQDAEMVHPVGAKSISTLLEDSTGKVWVGVGLSSDGIQILDKNKKQATQLNKQHGLGDNFIQNLMQVDGNVWIATDGGFDIIDLAKKSIEHTGKKEGLTNDTIYGILRDTKNNIWITGPSLGVDRIDSAKKVILHAGVEQGLSDENVVDVKQDKEGKVWIATYSKGVDMIDPEKGTIQNLKQGPGLSDSCNRMLMPDEFGRMWIGTDKGIYVADTKRGTLTSITTAEKLSDNYITSLVPYKSSMVAGTRNKVSIITPPSPENALWKVNLLAGSEGLVNSGNSWSTNTITKNGQYLWGDIGITVINDIKEQHDSAVTYVTGMSIMSQPRYFMNDPALGERDTLWTADSFY